MSTSNDLLVTLRDLLGTAQGRPMDEPPLPHGPAEDVLRLAEDALDDPAHAELDPGTRARLHAHAGNALRLLGHGRDGEALAHFRSAISLDPDNGDLHFDLSLLHKWRGRFTECLDAAERARALLGDQPRILWNAAIAATALGRGDVLQQVWARLAIPAVLEPGVALPIVPGMPLARLRVPSRGTGVGVDPVDVRAARFELPWVAPLSPVHGVLVSPTFGDAPVDYGDVVLWDA